MKQLISRLLSFHKKLSPTELAASLVELTIVIALVIVVSLTAARLMWGAMERNMEITVANNALSLLATIDTVPVVAEINSAGERVLLDKSELVAADGDLAKLVRGIRAGLTSHGNNKNLPVAAAAFAKMRTGTLGEETPNCAMLPGSLENVACRFISETGVERECTTDEVAALKECLEERGFFEECSNETETIIPVNIAGQCGVIGADDHSLMIIGTRTVGIPGGGT